MTIPTEPIGSIPRPRELLDAMQAFAAGSISRDELDGRYDDAVRDTIASLEAAGSPVVTDGEQRKPSFVTYPIDGLETLAPDGVTIPFADGHTRQLPAPHGRAVPLPDLRRLVPRAARPYAHRPLKQAVISASALSLLYPQDGIDGLLAGGVPRRPGRTRRNATSAAVSTRGADSVQIDFTEGRLAVKLDPSKGLLGAFVDLNNRVLARFSPEERARIGVHTCPGGDHDSTHSADVDYVELLPSLFAHRRRALLHPARERGRPAARAARDRRALARPTSGSSSA